MMLQGDLLGEQNNLYYQNIFSLESFMLNFLNFVKLSILLVLPLIMKTSCISGPKMVLNYLICGN